MTGFIVYFFHLFANAIEWERFERFFFSSVFVT